VGCGKSDSGAFVLHKDPRKGLPEPLLIAPAPWDAPTVANGFVPVAVVEQHPPTFAR